MDNEEQIIALFDYLKTNKKRVDAMPWVCAEEAWALPALDCKAFSILMLELLKVLKIKSELWVGVNGQEEQSHAWLELEINGEKKVVDREYPRPVPLEEYKHTNPYSLRTKIAYK